MSIHIKGSGGKPARFVDVTFVTNSKTDLGCYVGEDMKSKYISEGTFKVLEGFVACNKDLVEDAVGAYSFMGFGSTRILQFTGDTGTIVF